MLDHVGATDTVEAALEPARDAVYPCDKCGRETSQHTRGESTFAKDGQEKFGPPRRICSMPLCRHVQVVE